MGVYGLQTFIEKSEKYTQEIVSLVEEARTHARKHDTIPILAIDGLNAIPDIYNDPEPIIFGGQWRHFVTCIKKFVSTLQLFKIKPVFFFDGASHESHNVQWADRRKRELQNVKSIFEELMTNISPDLYGCGTPPSFDNFACFVVKYECNCDVRFCLSDADMTIAKFAKDTKECFGIFANDTDYLIFDTKPLYLSRKFDISKMTTEVWHRKRIAKILGLDTIYFPLMSCMAGNAVITYHELDTFHRALSFMFKENSEHRLKNVIDYINKKRHKLFDLKTISKQMEIPADQIKEGLESYKLKEVPDAQETEWCSAEELSLVREKCFKCETSRQIYNLLDKKFYGSKPYLQDPRMIPAALVYRKMRKRMYTILFGKEEEVREMCAYENSDLMNPEYVVATQIDMEVGDIPSLKKLWCNEVELEIRWKLFVSCLGITIPVSELENMQPTLITMCCILNYLLQNKELKICEYEVKAFICQAIYPCADNLIYLSELKIGKVSPRSVSLVALLIAGISNVVNVLDVCGSPYPIKEAMPWKYFDGKLFHHCYNLLKEGTLPEGVRALTEKKKLFEDLYRITTIGTHLSHAKLRESRINYKMAELRLDRI